MIWAFDFVSEDIREGSDFASKHHALPVTGEIRTSIWYDVMCDVKKKSHCTISAEMQRV